MAAVDFHALFTVLWSSLLAGVGVTVLFSFVILCWSRAAEASREGQRGEATAFLALAVVLLLVLIAAVAFGVTIMLRK